MSAMEVGQGRRAVPPLLAVSGLAKAYGGARALSRASLEIGPGEVHGLVGANGAGKSTFIKCLAGLTRPDSGTIEIDGQPVGPLTPQAAGDLGMSFIHQELAFVPGMTVLQNIMLGLPKKTRWGMVDWAAIARDVAPVAARTGITAPLSANVKGLSIAENWLINICRAQMRRARLIVMDEPTASLSAKEAGALFQAIRDLSSAGVAVLYVSHRLDEILDLCARVTVFRDGQSVAELSGATLTRRNLIDQIVGGRRAEAAAKVDHTRPQVVLSVRNLARPPRVHGVSFDLRAGEVLGIGGLVGAGRTELARLIFGADMALAGEMRLNGTSYAPRSPAAAVKAGVGLVPEERRAEALVLPKSVAFNLQIANLAKVVHGRALPFVSTRRREAMALRIIRDLAVKVPTSGTPVERLSGGNQQKVVIGRWLLRAPGVLILDEPTRGVDIGARAEIHRLIRDLAASGTAIIVISSEPDELPDLADRVLVMAEGRVVRELTGSGITRQAIVAASYAGQADHSEARNGDPT
ncbi:sugar ABC transporter ATP-binding protein [Rubellimicrobium arenae]|uniref:sugar ABC transporter ATP-binding protein n=1 Tax=Rubellimicrobium arenae TaxID=2817372 RepID=UPI001B30BFE2|nr:sugar ABC transporter ATP-binding protein [Rubellimicrobium arenae]